MIEQGGIVVYEDNLYIVQDRIIFRSGIITLKVEDLNGKLKNIRCDHCRRATLSETIKLIEEHNDSSPSNRG